jgi:F-type H+-transporting ATPase subunit alpha
MNMEPESLQNVFDRTFAGIRQVREAFTPQLTPREVGTITSVSTGIAKVSGLPGVGFDELVTFPGDLLGIAFNVDADEIGVVLLGEYWHLHAGDEVQRTGRVMDVAVGDGLLGRVIDPLGRPLDGKGPVASGKRLPIERPAAPIMDRAPVTVPLQTGLKVIDALIPVGRGQRELILGDRQTGKTAISIDTILNQRDHDVLCVYCAIGQRASAVAKAVATLREKGAMDYTVIVVTEGNDPPGLAYIAPYAATSIAESFMEAGRDVLIVYDDLTHHARAYRELSLLLRRPPGREAFPGDIFYIHSRLLERATHLREELGGGSLTALPIIETEAQNISAYIPTNLISITDGQIYLSPSLFELGVLPAVDVGKSVSRVGGKAQRAAYRVVAGDLKLGYAQFEELETFSRFGARLDEDTRKIIEHGRRIRACLKQPEFAPVSVPSQIAVLLALIAELFDNVPLDQMTDAEHALCEAAADIPAEVRERLDTADNLSDDDRKTIIEIARKALEEFQPKPEKNQETKEDTKPKAKKKPEGKSDEPGTDSKPEPKQETEEQSKPEAKAERKSDSKPNESKPEPKLEPKQKSEEDKQPKAQAEPKSKPESKPEVQTEVKPKPEPEEKS